MPSSLIAIPQRNKAGASARLGPHDGDSMDKVHMQACRRLLDGSRWAALAALLAASVVAVPARADFGAPVNLSKPNESAAYPQIGMDADGNAVIVWQNFNNGEVQARRRTATGAFSAVQTIIGGQIPQIAVDAQGNAVIVWFRFDGANTRIQARRRSAAGALSAVQTLSAAGRSADSQQVAIDADGDAVIAWRRWDGLNWRIQARRRAATGVLGPIETLSGPGQDATEPQVAVDASGDAVIVWYRSDGTNQRIQARALSAAGVLGPLQTLSQAGQNALNPQVAVSAGGKAVIVWQRFVEGHWRIQARTRSPGGGLSAIQTLSADSGSASDPQVGLDANGNAVIVWVRGTPVSPGRVQVRRRSAAGALSGVQTLSAASSQSAFEPEVAVDAGGDAVIVWRRFDGSNWRIQARTRSAGGALGPIQTLSATGQTATAAQVAADQSGDAVAVWYRPDAAGFQRVQATAGP